MYPFILNHFVERKAAAAKPAFKATGFLKNMVAATALLLGSTVHAQKPKPPKPILPVVVERGRIVYNADSLTGDQVPDFSYCGYKASEEDIPTIVVKAVVPLVKGDATAAIQNAIDKVAAIQPDPSGFRGAVLLSKGNYEVAGQLKITVSGIVLRGFGAQGQTVVTGKGVDRDGLIRFFGKDDKKTEGEKAITQNYVPVGALSFEVADPADFRAGDRVQIKRPSTPEWIAALGTDDFGGGVSALGWKPGDVDLYFDRTIVAIEGNRITIDAPLTTSLDPNYGVSTIVKYSWPGRIHNIGIENLTLTSDFDRTNAKDEEHRWMAVTFTNAEDAWVRQLSFKHFAGSAVFINETARRITVEDCISTEPVSEIGGQRRYTFFTRGQQTLFQRCFAANGYHDYSVGHAAAGPNAFVQCVSERPYSFSGAIGRWASGILFDIMEVDGNAIRLGNRGQDGRGAGWSGANSFLWNCTASLIECDKPPTAQNWSYGSWSEFAGKGFWAESNNHVNPRSFYYLQLAQRLGKDVSQRAAILDIGGEASSSPSVAVAQELTAEASKPKITMYEWIRQASKRNPVSTDAQSVKPETVKTNGSWSVYPPLSATGLKVNNGWLMLGQEVAVGRRQSVPWWTGGVEAKALEQAKERLSVTRFVPGRVGAGLTDELDEVIQTMKSRNIVALEHNYGLWYDRRRDDHERIRRMTGEVWPPFYELPFARSGKDSAWDGLSKYDLTKYNDWYWTRLRDFASLASLNKLVLIHQNYFQHNIIEAGAHYADFPWRSANNINNTGFNEPVNYAGDKRIFYAEQFYDVSNPVRRKIHQLYIEKCLDNFKNTPNVIQLTSEEFTGPLHFVEFWLQTIAGWEKKNQAKQIIGLSATKDVQDAILKNPKYAPVVNLIDIRYWYYQADGTPYAPEGGKNLAPRQWARQMKSKGTSFEQVYRAVKEYRLKYPGKAVMYSSEGADRFGWAIFIAGGSMPALPEGTDQEFLRAAATMKPSDKAGDYALVGKEGIIVMSDNKQVVTVDLSAHPGHYNANFIDLASGRLIPGSQTVTAGKAVTIELPKQGAILWLKK